VSALSIALLSPLAVQAQTASSGDAQSAQSSSSQTTSASSQQPSEKKAVKLQAVTVTGSMIPRVEVEGPTPVVSISGTQIRQQGYTTLNEFLDSLPQMGPQTQDPSSWGATAISARPLNLRSLGPGFSLLLINGVRVVDDPQPLYAGSNFQNSANIPTGMIDHIEILASGASSIYGSDAVAGVVNVILKKNYSGDDLQVTGGGDSRGGRAYGDINFSGGKSGDNWHVVYNVEKSNRAPLWGSDRSYQDSESDAGYGTWGPAARMFGYQDSAALSAQDGNGVFLAPPAGTCGKFTNSQLTQAHIVTTNGTQVTGSTNNGSYCSQPALFQNWVLTDGTRSNDGYVAGEYDFSDGLQLYGSAALYNMVSTSNTQMWGESTGPFYDQTTGQVISGAVRQLTAQETGTAMNTHDREQNWNLTAGLRGTMFNSNVNWDFSLNSQRYTVREDYTGWDQQAANNFFLGNQLGTKTVSGYSAINSGGSATIPVYAMNWQQWWNPITPQQYSQFAVNGENTATSWLDQAQLHLNGELFSLPWVDDNPIGWATVLEAANNGYLLSPDSRSADSATFMNPFEADNTGGGTRQRYSLGAELRMPLLNSVTWTLSGRLDKYHDASSADVARTWGTGIEWRPYDGLLLRGSYGTNFKAPDMQAIYLKGSTSPIGDYTDPLQCIEAIKAGVNNSPWCVITQYPPSQYYQLNTNGSRLLLPQTGHSWTYGFVWQVPGVQGLSVSADYWHMGVSNAIEYLGAATVLADEAGCLTGLQPDGSSGLSPYTAHDLGSTYCKMVEQMVQRNAAGQVVSEESGPINEASLYVSGVDASLEYKWHTDDYGDFNTSINYTDNLSYKSRTLASDPLLNTRYQNPASRVTWIGNWHKGDWDVSISGVRVGSVRANNYAGCSVLANGIQPSAITATAADGTSYSTGVCTVQENGVAVPISDSLYYGRVPVWITWNGSVAWQFNPETKLTFTVNNLFDKVGGINYYSGGFEFVNTNQTAAEYVGREMFLSFDYKFN
jgi:outer membrane receptor protein involved in Fe transport